VLQFLVSSLVYLTCSYSSEGVLVAVDSAGMVRSLCATFGTSWTPILDMGNNVSKQHVTCAC